MIRWRFLAALAGVLVVSWWAGCSNPNLAGGKLHFDQASRLTDPAERAARFERARETFQKAVEEMPESGEARLWLGRTYAELDQPDSAAVNFRMAKELDPTLEVADVRGHYFAQKYQDGQTSAGNAAELQSQGATGGAQDKYREALDFFRESTIYDPGRPEGFAAMGKMYFNLGKVDSAITMFQTVRQMAPDDPDVRRLLYDVYRSQGDDAFQTAVDKGSAGDSTASRTYFEAAARFYASADSLSEGPDPDLAFQRGSTSYELAQLDPAKKQEYMADAVRRYEEVLNVNPVDVEVLYNLSLVLRDLERYEEAGEMAQRLVDLAPRDGTYRDILGRIQDKLGDKEALVSGVIFGRALKNGMKVDVGEAAREAEAAGPQSDIKRRYLENGPPEEILVWTDTQNQQYVVWFYWERGLAYGFQGGKEKASSQFAPSGVLNVSGLGIAPSGASQIVKGIVTNSSARKYSHVRVEIRLTDDEGNDLGTVVASTDKLDPRGDWAFEIPLNGEKEEAATKAELVSVLGY